MAGLLTWHVAFERGRTPWGHVLAYAFDGRSYVVIDPHVRWTEVFTLTPGVEFDAWQRDLAGRADIYRVEGGGRASMFAGIFCVGKVKHLLGLRSGAFSPTGLKRDLLKAGAQKVCIREGQDPQGRPRHEIGA